MNLMTRAQCSSCGARQAVMILAGTTVFCDHCRSRALRFLWNHDLLDHNPMAVILGLQSWGHLTNLHPDWFHVYIQGNYLHESEMVRVKFPLTGRYSYANLTAR